MQIFVNKKITAYHKIHRERNYFLPKRPPRLPPILSSFTFVLIPSVTALSCSGGIFPASSLTVPIGSLSNFSLRLASPVIFDARSHGENAYDKCTLGYVESEDLKHVIDDTRARFANVKILGLQGESMGSTTCIHSLRFDPHVDFIVSDCAIIGTYEVLYDCYKNVHLQFLVPLCWLFGKLVYRIDFKQTDARKYLADNKTPILFIHGAGDTFIKPYNASVLYDIASKGSAHTELIFVEGAGHARSREVAGFETYTGYIGDFLKNSGII